MERYFSDLIPGVPQVIIASSTEDTASTPEQTAVTPPQASGAPMRFRIDGSAKGTSRLNAAMRALLDPAARTRATRVYSGQSRVWER